MHFRWLASLSRVVSRGVSAAPSLLGSRMGSRCDSMSSLYEVDGPLPDTIGQIQAVTEQQEAVISYYYTGEDNQVSQTAPGSPQPLSHNLYFQVKLMEKYLCF